MTPTVKIVLVDDHTLIRSSLANLVNEFENCRVIFEACNGLDFIRQVKNNTVPDLVILDLNMEEMDGYETAKWLYTNLPQVRILMLSMYSTEMSLLRMLKIGVKGF